MKKAGKISLVILGIIVLFIGVFIFLLVLFDTDHETEIPQLEDYKINVVGKFEGNVNPDDFSAISDYVIKSEKMNPYNYMFFNICELPSCFSMYYFDNDLYSSDIEVNDQLCYFLGKKPENPCFGFFINKDYEDYNWYISKDYQLPDAYDNSFSEVYVVENNEENVNGAPYYNGYLPRVSMSDAVRIADIKAVEKCRAQFSTSGYDFFEIKNILCYRNSDYDFLKKYVKCNPFAEYLVLAKFDDSGIYQLLGVISRDDSVFEGFVELPDISDDFTWKNFLYYYSDGDELAENERNLKRYYARYYEAYYNLGPDILHFTDTESSFGDFDYTVYSNGKAVINYYNGSESEIVIPNKIDGYDVVGIMGCGEGKNRFYAPGVKVKKITFQEGIRFIGPDVFTDCHSLKEVSLPESLRFIYKAAFYNCRSLKKINSPENLQYVYMSAFAGCKKNIENAFDEDIVFD